MWHGGRTNIAVVEKLVRATRGSVCSVAAKRQVSPLHTSLRWPPSGVGSAGQDGISHNDLLGRRGGSMTRVASCSLCLAAPSAACLRRSPARNASTGRGLQRLRASTSQGDVADSETSATRSPKRRNLTNVVAHRIDYRLWCRQPSAQGSYFIDTPRL